MIPFLHYYTSEFMWRHVPQENEIKKEYANDRRSKVKLDQGCTHFVGVSLKP